MLRIATWNCYSGKPETRLKELQSLAPDLVSLQECSRPFSDSPEKAWLGDKPQHGVFVHVQAPYQLKTVKVSCAAKYFLTAKVSGPLNFNIVAIWSKKSNKRPLYVTTLQRGISFLESFISSGPTILLGDLNTARFLSAGDSHMEFVHRLENNFGLVSAYHTFHGCDHGYERHSTHFHRRNQQAGFHIDYCFIPMPWTRAIVSVQTGRYSKWKDLSDHVPLLVELDERRISSAKRK